MFPRSDSIACQGVKWVVTVMIPVFPFLCEAQSPSKAVEGAVLAQASVPRAPSAAPSGQSRGPEGNLMLAAAQAIGVKRCVPALNRLSSLSLRSAATHDIVLDWDRRAPDDSPFFALMGVVEPTSGVHAVTFAAVPDEKGGCSVLAERIAWAPKSCSVIAREELTGYTAAQLVPGMWVLTHPNDPGSTISLLEAGAGCTVIRRFVQLRWVESNPALAMEPRGYTGSSQSTPQSSVQSGEAAKGREGKGGLPSGSAAKPPAQSVR